MQRRTFLKALAGVAAAPLAPVPLAQIPTTDIEEELVERGEGRFVDLMRQRQRETMLQMAENLDRSLHY